MRVYLKQNVFDAALDRIRWLYDEFPEVVINFSGGKDSTVVLELALIVAKEKNRLPLKVFWLDQEAEWRATVEMVRDVMSRPDVEPYWFQGEFKLFNATTTDEDAWLHCWRDGEEWMRPKEPNSIHRNETGVERFTELLDAFSVHYFPDRPVARLAGVRCEESPARLMGLTGAACYKSATWGALNSRQHQHYLFYPLYDWGWRDIWTAIHQNQWKYNALYDHMWQYGLKPRDMRVSNVHHETALAVLWFLQEIEPDTWDAVVKRVKGVNTVGRCGDAYRCPSKLPRMFTSWREYRDYLLRVLILDPVHQAAFTKAFASYDRRFEIEDPAVEESLMRHCVSSLLINDWEGVLHAQYAITQSGSTRTGRRKRAAGEKDHWSIAARRAREARLTQESAP